MVECYLTLTCPKCGWVRELSPNDGNLQRVVAQIENIRCPGCEVSA